MSDAGDAYFLAVQLVEHFEGFRAVPYRDGAGTWTIGIGSTRLADGSPVGPSTSPVTREQAEDLMRGELGPTGRYVDARCPAGATTAQRAACYDFAYNLGQGAWNGSTLRNLWLAGDVERAAAEFARWVYAGGKIEPGLVKRRRAEATLFLTGRLELPEL